MLQCTSQDNSFSACTSKCHFNHILNCLSCGGKDFFKYFWNKIGWLSLCKANFIASNCSKYSELFYLHHLTITAWYSKWQYSQKYAQVLFILILNLFNLGYILLLTMLSTCYTKDTLLGAKLLSVVEIMLPCNSFWKIEMVLWLFPSFLHNRHKY